MEGWGLLDASFNTEGSGGLKGEAGASQGRLETGRKGRQTPREHYFLEPRGPWR